MNTLRNVLLFIVLTVFAVSCEDPVSPELECEVSLDTENIELEAGETQTVSANKSEECASSLKFHVSKSYVASVEKVSKNSAEITAKEEGEATINIMVEESDEKVANINIKVTFNPVVAFQEPNNGNEQAIWIANKKGQKRKITSSNGNVFPQWISNGERVAYLSNLKNVYSVDLKGNNIEKLTTGFDQILWFEISPEEKYISLSGRKSSDGPFEIYTQNLKTGEINRITFQNRKNGEVPSSPTWSPDGKKIAFSSFSDNSREVFVSNPDGTGKQKITNDPEFINGGPKWSPFDKEKLLFISDRSGELAIYTMDSDGNNQKHVPTGSLECENWISQDEIICVNRSSGNTDVLKSDLNGSSELLFNTKGYIGSTNWKPQTD